jgi:hypothetical protein
MADPEKHGSIEYFKGCLRRIGLNLVQAADTIRKSLLTQEGLKSDSAPLWSPQGRG